MGERLPENGLHPSNCTLYSLKPYTELSSGKVQISECPTRSHSTRTRVFWFRLWIFQDLPGPVPLDKANVGSGNEIAIS